MEIELRNLILVRGSRRVLRGIDWHLRPGEHWLVAGGNGAGKTQLLKVLAGDIWPAPAREPARRYRLGRRWLSQPQEVKDSIAYVGPERQDRHERYGWNHRAWEVVATGLHYSDIPLQDFSIAERRQSLSLLRRAGIAALAERNFLTLSYGERRLVLLARALAQKPQVLLLDEVFTGLDGANRLRAQQLLARLRSPRMIRVVTAHRREDVPPGVNRLLLLEGGSLVWSGPASATRLAAVLPGEAARVPRRGWIRGRVGPVLVRMQDVSVFLDGKRVLREISFALRQGECWVVHGGNGSGKSTLLRTVFGEHGAARGGSIERAGIGQGVSLSEFRERTGFIAPQLQADYPRNQAVLDTVVSGRYASIGLNEPATASELRMAMAILRRHGIGALARRKLGELSYGQVRRVLFARAAMAQPRLLLLDEPFSGLSGVARTGMQRALAREIRDGLTVMLATHYPSEWPTGTTHEIELTAGRIAFAGPLRSLVRRRRRR